MTTPVISARGLRKEYTYHRQQPGLRAAARGFLRRDRAVRVAVDSLDLDVGRGEFVGLLGRNGAGKTTTLKMMSGLLRPTAGDVRVLDSVPHRRRYDFLRRIAVVLGQKSMLWWDVSTLDSLALHRAMYDLAAADVERTTAELAELLQLRDLLDVPVRKLSLGERLKCELLVALVHRPEVLFLDEPTIGLDVVSKATTRDFLAVLNREQQTTVVLTSHDMDDVAQLCRRVLLVDGGRLRFDGTPAELVHQTQPHKRIRLSYARGAHPPQRWPDGVRLVEHRGSPRGTQLDLEVARPEAAGLLAEAARWGELVDLEVRDADLDEVMRAVLAGGLR